MKDRREYGRDVLDSYQRTVFGLTELLTKTWEIIDNPKTDAKQRIKAITVAQVLHNQLFEFKKLLYEMVQFKEYAQQIMKKEEDIDRREKALNAFLEGRKLTQQEIDFETDPNLVF